jgi:hypothetical protein
MTVRVRKTHAGGASPLWIVAPGLLIVTLLVGCDLIQGQDQQSTTVPPIVQSLQTFLLDFARQVATAFLL